MEPVTAPDHAMQMAPDTAARARDLPPAARHELFEAEVEGYFFSPATHEKDLFDAAEVAARARRWAKRTGPVETASPTETAAG
jgi:hypothetical protein